MNAIFAALLILTVAIASVVLGVFCAYCAISGLLAALNPSRPAPSMAVLVPHESSAGAD